jgi:hypothetical protein
MPVILPESKSEVVEDDQLLPEPKVEEGDEFVSLDPEPEEKKEPAPAAKKAAPAKKAEKSEPAPSTDDDLPDDLKGKSPAQIAKMLKEAQSLIGRQGSELGEFRRKADILIQASLASLQKAKEAEPAPKKEEPAEIDDTEFFANPRSALAKAIANDPVIKEIREKLGQAAADRETSVRTESSARFNQAHPDAAEIMQDPEFRTWVEASRVRTALLHRAHAKYDFDAGDEVFGTWKALKGVKKAEATAPASDTTAAAKTLAAAAAAKRKADLSAAATPTGGSAGGGKAEGGKKIYRRADVLRLMEEDPDRYEALANEISLAYSEGRVR